MSPASVPSLSEALRSLVVLCRPYGFETEHLRAWLEAHASHGASLTVLGEAMTAGRLTTAAWREATSLPEPVDFIAAMGALWDRCVSLGAASGVEGFPEPWEAENLRLWAYTENWLVTEQDEDLALADERFVPTLLALSTESACPKRDLVLDLLFHWARDAASGAATREGFAAVVARLAAHAARATDPGLAAYLERLGSYGRPSPVDRDGAHQRGVDLAPSYALGHSDVMVRDEGSFWSVELPARRLRIDKANGRIF